VDLDRHHGPETCRKVAWCLGLIPSHMIPLPSLKRTRDYRSKPLLGNVIGGRCPAFLFFEFSGFAGTEGVGGPRGRLRTATVACVQD